MVQECGAGKTGYVGKRDGELRYEEFQNRNRSNNKKTFIIIFSAAVALVYCVRKQHNPVAPILGSAGHRGQCFESVISFLQILLPGLY